MKYFLDGTWCNDDTIKSLPNGATALSDAEWDNRQGTPYVQTPAELQATLNQKHRAYLASTDYMAIREYEGGKPMPANIKELRAAAREGVL